MRKLLLTLMVLVCCFAGSFVANALTTTANATNANYTNKTVAKSKFEFKNKGKKNAVVKRASTQLSSACHNHLCSANQGFSTTYQWTDCGGVVRRQYVAKGSSITVCAQVGTVSGGPWTDLGTTCN